MATNGTLTASSTVLYLTMVQKQVIRTLPILLVSGLVGNISSCLIFHERELRYNAVSRLLKSACIFNIIVLCYAIGINLYNVDHVSADTYSLIFCKLRLYIRHILLMIVRTYVTLACAASFALSSTKVNLRALCRPKYIQLAIISVPFVWILVPIHMPFLKTIRNNICIDIDPYVVPFAVYFFLIVGVFPIIVMTIFTLLTIHNLHLLHNRVQATIITPVRIKTRDRQFIRMLVSLVIMYLITNLYFPTNALYQALTYWQKKSPERVAIDSLIFSITSNHILYINNVSPFYLFFYSSLTFRKMFQRILHRYVDTTVSLIRKFFQRTG